MPTPVTITREGRRVRPRLTAGVAAIMLAIGLAATQIPATPADAYVLNPQGCHMPSSPIYYYFFVVSTPYQTAFNSSQASWDATSAWGYFASTTNQNAANIWVYDYYYGPDAGVAWVTGSCNQGGVWSNNRVSLSYNQSIMDSYSTTLKKVIGIHELGHTYGLAHNSQPLTCTNQVGQASMMRDAGWMWTNCSYQTPLVDDVAGVNAIY